jgi:hypothetical protein
MSMPSDAELDRRIAAKLVARLAGVPETMAWVIARYKEIEQVDDALVARQLNIDVHQLHHLALCGRPRSVIFDLDIETIAEHIGVDQQLLASLVRHVEALETFRTYQDVAAAGMLAAARDWAAEEPGEYEAEQGNDDSAPTSEPDDEQ